VQGQYTFPKYGFKILYLKNLLCVKGNVNYQIKKPEPKKGSYVYFSSLLTKLFASVRTS